MATSVIPDFDLIKGNSTDLYLLGVKGYAKLGDDWECDFAIRDINNAIALQGSLSKNIDIENEPDNKYFTFQLFPSESETLIENQKYTLYVKVYNSVLNINREIVQSKIKVLPKGV